MDLIDWLIQNLDSLPCSEPEPLAMLMKLIQMGRPGEYKVAVRTKNVHASNLLVGERGYTMGDIAYNIRNSDGSVPEYIADKQRMIRNPIFFTSA